MNDLVNLAKERTETRRGGDWLNTLAGPSSSVTTSPAEADEWPLVFDFAKNPIPANGPRGSHYAHARAVKGVRLITKREAGYAGIPHLDRCRVVLTWYVLDNRRRDAVNLAPLLKAMQDGLVDAGVVPDDTPDRMDAVMPKIVLVDKFKHRSAWMELVVSRWEGPGE